MSATRDYTTSAENSAHQIPTENRSLVADIRTTEIPVINRKVYVSCDGAIKRPGIISSARVLASRHTPATPEITGISPAAKPAGKRTRRARLSKQLSQADHTSLDLITSAKSLLWLQKVSEKRLAVQWNIPNNIQRNCQDLFLHTEESGFTLRLFQNIAVGNAEWKSSRRTLEYPIDISRRKCYVNIENAGGGIFTAEIGIRSANGKFIFIARSAQCATARFQSETGNQEIIHKASSTPEQRIITPRLFKARGKIQQTTISAQELKKRDILAEALVNGVYTDFLNEGPKVLRRCNEPIAPSSIAARADYLATLQQPSTASAKTRTREKLSSRRLDPENERSYQHSPVQNFPKKQTGYIPEKLGKDDIPPSGIMIASMLNTQRNVAIDVFKKGENPAPDGHGRRVVRVQSKTELAKALGKSGIHEHSELILKGRLSPGRRVRVGGLLINTEADGSFFVSCSIRNGKLHVPVEEIDAIITE